MTVGPVTILMSVAGLASRRPLCRCAWLWPACGTAATETAAVSSAMVMLFIVGVCPDRLVEFDSVSAQPRAVVSLNAIR